MMPTGPSVSCMLVAAALASPALGQPCEPAWDLPFGNPGANGDVRSWAASPDGTTMYVSGGFLEIGGVAALRVAQWSDGAWAPVGVGANSRVQRLMMYDDGSGAALFATGPFTQIGGNVINRIAKWDGENWLSLGVGLGPAGAAGVALAAFDDGTGDGLYVGGAFTTAGGAGANRIARWRAGAWSPLGAGVGPAGSAVQAIVVFDDGDGEALYAAGTFTTAGGQPASKIAKWNGAAWSALGAGLNGDAMALAVYDDGGGDALYVAGFFTTAGGAPAARVAKWSGDSWSALGAGIPTAGTMVRALCAFDDGTGEALYAGGDFLVAGEGPVGRVARWRDGAWSAVGAGVGGAVAELAGATLNGAPTLYVGGDFTSVGGMTAGRIARWVGCASEGSPADLNGDGIVNASDLALLLGAWGLAGAGGPADINDDGAVTAADLALLLGAWG